MPTFPRGFVRHLSDVANAKLLERLARESGGNLAEEQRRVRVRRERPFEFPVAAELRGIPVVGEGIGGTSPGTAPANPRRRRDGSVDV